MNFKSVTMILASASLAVAYPVPDNIAESPNVKARDCTITSSQSHWWVKDGLTRNQVDFDSTGLNQPWEYCRFWDYHNEEAPTFSPFNVQCWMLEEGGTEGRVHVSFFRGPAGDGEFQSMLERSMQWWNELSGCTIE